MKSKAIILVGFLMISLGKNAFAGPISAPEIIKNFDDLLRGNSSHGTYIMQIVTPSWQRELKLFVYSLGREKMFIRILSPDKERGIGSLRIGNEMWNYLPRVEKQSKSRRL